MVKEKFIETDLWKMFRHVQNLGREASFVIPIKEGKILMGRRRNQPYKGLYSMIGGKNEKNHDYMNLAPYHTITKPGGIKAVSIVDRMAQARGKEIPGETALREMCEELYARSDYPDTFREIDFSLKRLGSLTDVKTLYECHVYIACLDEVPYKLSIDKEEIEVLKELKEITAPQIAPPTQVVLEHIRWLDENVMFFKPYEGYRLERQIPTFERLPVYPTLTLTGAFLHHMKEVREVI